MKGINLVVESCIVSVSLGDRVGVLIMIKRSLVLAVMAMGVVAHGSIIYSNFAPSNGYNNLIGNLILEDPEIYFPRGERFTAGVTGTAHQLDIAIGHVSGNTSVSMGLFFDVGGTIFGQLGSLVPVTTQASSFGYPAAYQSLNVSGAGWNVVAGTTYWLVAFPSTNSNHGWQWNSTGATGIHYAGGNYNPSLTQGVFRLETVPEPASFVALAVGACVLRLRSRRTI